jgi:hypothetical protein
MTTTALAEPAAMSISEPVRLTESQMDTLTAGTVAVSVAAIATAEGDSTYTSTITTTNALSLGKGVVEKAEGKAEAFAYGTESADTAVWTYGYGDGKITVIKEKFFNQDRGTVSYSSGSIKVHTVHPPGLIGKNPPGLSK